MLRSTLKKTFLGCVGVLLTTAAVAQDHRQGDGAEVSLDDLRAKCEAILGNPQMVKPSITLTCDQHRFVWRECTSTFPMNEPSTINSTLGMKDWQVSHAQGATSTVQKGCTVFSRHDLYTRPVEDTMRCEDLLADLRTQGDLAAHCDNLLRERVAQDPGLVVDQGPTGEVIDTCRLGKDHGQATLGGDPCKEGPDQGSVKD